MDVKKMNCPRIFIYYISYIFLFLIMNLDNLRLQVLSVEKSVLLMIRSIEFFHKEEVFGVLERVGDKLRMFLNMSNPRHVEISRRVRKHSHFKIRETTTQPIRSFLYLPPLLDDILLLGWLVELVYQCHPTIEFYFLDKYQEHAEKTEQHLLDLYELGYWQDHASRISCTLQEPFKTVEAFMGMDIVALRRLGIFSSEDGEEEEDYVELHMTSRYSLYLTIKFSQTTQSVHGKRIQKTIKTLLSIFPFQEGKKQVVEAILESTGVLEINSIDFIRETSWDVPWMISNLARIFDFFEHYDVYPCFLLVTRYDEMASMASSLESTVL